MYWYPLDKEEEDTAWDQAEAQADEYGNEAWDGAAKFIGNLGELAVAQFFDDFFDVSQSGVWEYHNASAMKNAEPEFSDNDFRLVEFQIDVKATTDIRKFSPMHAYEGENQYGLGPVEEGFPKVDTEKDTDVFVFVLLDTPEKPSPVPSDASEAEGWAINYEHTGNYIAIILGWMFSDAFTGEAIGNLGSVRGKFTRLHVRDLYELLVRSGVA